MSDAPGSIVPIISREKSSEKSAKKLKRRGEHRHSEADQPEVSTGQGEVRTTDMGPPKPRDVDPAADVMPKDPSPGTLTLDPRRTEGRHPQTDDEREREQQPVPGTEHENLPDLVALRADIEQMRLEMAQRQQAIIQRNVPSIAKKYMSNEGTKGRHRASPPDSPPSNNSDDEDNDDGDSRRSSDGDEVEDGSREELVNQVKRLQKALKRAKTQGSEKVSDWLLKPPILKGRPLPTELEGWYSQMETYMSHMQSARRNVYAFTLNKLEGEGLAWVKNCMQLKVAQEPEFKATWSWLKEQLDHRFGVKDKVWKKREELHALTFDGGKPSEYIAKTLTLHTEMSEAPMAEVDRVYWFLKNCRVDVLRHRIEFNPHSDTGRWESLQELIDYIKPKFADVNYPYPNEKRTPTCDADLQKEASRGRTEWKDKKRKREKARNSDNPDHPSKKPKDKQSGLCDLSRDARQWYRKNNRCMRCGQNRHGWCDNAKALATDLPADLRTKCSVD